jgi:hypothetical protein
LASTGTPSKLSLNAQPSAAYYVANRTCICLHLLHRFEINLEMTDRTPFPVSRRFINEIVLGEQSDESAARYNH